MGRTEVKHSNEGKLRGFRPGSVAATEGNNVNTQAMETLHVQNRNNGRLDLVKGTLA